MFEIKEINEIKWRDGNSMLREFVPEFKQPHLKVLAQLLKVISRDVDFFLLKDINSLSRTDNKIQFCDTKWGLWKDEPKVWEESLPLQIREETGYQLGDVVTVFSGDHLPYVVYRPLDDRVFIIDYYKDAAWPVEISLCEMRNLLVWWKEKVGELSA